MKVSAVVVTFNRVKLLKACLEGLLDQTFPLYRIFVINNNSSDGTKQYLLHITNNKIIVKNMKKNVGGAGGFNEGISLAYKYSTSDYFWIMDDDTVPSKDSLENLIHSSLQLNQSFGFLCSNVRWWENNYPSNIPKPSYDWPKLISKNLVKIDTATFVSILIPRTEVRKLGLPIAAMFIWGDDTEYTMRLSNDKPCYFVSDSIAYHKTPMNRSYETIYNAATNRLKFYKYMYRNLIYIYRKNHLYKDLFKKLMSDILNIIFIPFESKNNRLYRIYCVCVGMISGIFFNPKVDYPK